MKHRKPFLHEPRCDSPWNIVLSSEVVILMGIQGSGKTTFYMERYRDTHKHVSKDNFRHNKDRKGRQKQLIEEALSSGENVIVDNTNVEVKDRIEIIEQAKKLQPDCRITGFFFETPYLVCIAQNAQRTGRARVPEKGIGGTAKRLVRPSLEEGFDQLYSVYPQQKTPLISSFVTRKFGSFAP